MKVISVTYLNDHYVVRTRTFWVVESIWAGRIQRDKSIIWYDMRQATRREKLVEANRIISAFLDMAVEKWEKSTGSGSNSASDTSVQSS